MPAQEVGHRARLKAAGTAAAVCGVAGIATYIYSCLMRRKVHALKWLHVAGAAVAKQSNLAKDMLGVARRSDSAVPEGMS